MNFDHYIQQIIQKAQFNRVENASSLITACDIIIPIYNGFEALQKCLESVFSHTSNHHRVILLNDASTDKRVKPFLDGFSERTNVAVVHRQQNMGYLRNVNKTLKQFSRDVVLLNSDTVVTNGWLEELTLIASSSGVGIVCPLSDNATILSVDNNLLQNTERLGRFHGQWYPIPTAVGSCMLMKKEILSQFGCFDEYYHPGYGEECDYSMRIREKGYSVACAPAAFVYHVGSQSFSENSERLKEQHQKLLDLRWPGYDKEIQGFIENNPVEIVNQFLAQNEDGKNILHVVHGLDDKGGVEIFTSEILKGVGEDYFHSVLRPERGLETTSEFDRNSVRVTDFPNPQKRRYLTSMIGNRNANLYEENLDIYFCRLLLTGNYSFVHFHSLVDVGSLVWPLICKAIKIPYIFSAHDHFFICYNYSLIDTGTREYCAKSICTSIDKGCVKCLHRVTSYNVFDTKDYIDARNLLWKKILKGAEKIITPSNYLLNLIRKNHPEIENKNLETIEPFITTDIQSLQVNENGRLCVAFLGVFTIEKGSDIFLEAYHKLKELNIHWKIIGNINPIYNQILEKLDIELTGKYERENLTKYLYGVDLVILPSIRPETYSITLSECWYLGLPVIVADIGAYKSRVIEGNNGLLFRNNDSDNLAEKIRYLISNPEMIYSMKSCILENFKNNKSPISSIREIYQNISQSKNMILVFKSDIEQTENTLTQPAESAYQDMQNWLDAPYTLEAESDWKTAEPISIFIVGDNPDYISKTLDSCKLNSPGSQVIICNNQLENVDFNNVSVCLIILAGNLINENFGNWLYSFQSSEKPIGMSDYCLVNQESRFYAPQFSESYDKFLFQRQEKRVGAMLWNKNKSDGFLTAIVYNVIFKSENIHRIITACFQHGNDSISYFPFLSYYFDDVSWVNLWKKELIGQNTQGESENDLMSVSVVVLSGHNGKLLNQLIYCIKNQIGINIENIFVLIPEKTGTEKIDNISFHLVNYDKPEKTLNEVIKLSQSETLCFINDNVQLSNKNCLKNLVSVLADEVDAVSPVYQNYRLDYIVSNKLGQGELCGQGIVRKTTFDNGNYPLCSDLLDSDCFLVTSTALKDCGGFDSIGRNFYLSTRLSQKLKTASKKIALQSVNGMYRHGLPDYVKFTATEKSLDEERDSIYLSDSTGFYKKSINYSSSYSNRGHGLDQYFGAFKTPKSLPRVLAYSNDSWASGFYRVKAPVSALVAANILSCNFLPEEKKKLTANIFEIAKQKPDVLLLHNFLSDLQLAALKSYKNYLDVPLVFSLDDLVTEIPSYNYFSKLNPEDTEKRLITALKYVDRLIVSTEYLAERMSSVHNDIVVINNMLPKSLWKDTNYQEFQNKKIRIGWAGAEQHRDDLLWLKPVIESTSEYVDWVFMGYIPDELRIEGVEFHPAVPLASYHTKLIELKLDIAIAPLIDNSFNRAKSNLKLLEYGALGLPVVCSQILCYQDSPANQLENNYTAWIQTIIELAENSAYRRQQGDRMRSWVYENYLLEDHLHKWQNALFLNQ